MSKRTASWIAALALAVAACSSSDADEATEQQLAQELVDSTRAAGIQPELTAEIAAALYGTDASSVCDAFDGGLTTSAASRLLGNPGHGRRNNVTETAVAYAGLVIRTYCPDLLPDFAHAIEDVDPVDVTR
ncbi:hypothetical protein [Ilumatobacter sp.]|uniref:hypothetical protein n=1 Tax=Ilumatobacter sp. TaxID=1967498 RepID=UPI003C61D842